MKLRETPLCEICGDPATEVDHKTPRSKGGTDADSNLQSLCEPCHSTKTGREGREAAFGP